MRKVEHKTCVKLYDVIYMDYDVIYMDDYVFIIMELVEGSDPPGFYQFEEIPFREDSMSPLALSSIIWLQCMVHLVTPNWCH